MAARSCNAFSDHQGPDSVSGVGAGSAAMRTPYMPAHGRGDAAVWCWRSVQRRGYFVQVLLTSVTDDTMHIGIAMSGPIRVCWSREVSLTGITPALGAEVGGAMS
jgi:hypothetical protein